MDGRCVPNKNACYRRASNIDRLTADPAAGGATLTETRSRHTLPGMVVRILCGIAAIVGVQLPAVSACAQTASPATIIVLANDTVIRGEISQTNDGIRVRTASGSIVELRLDQVAFVEDTLDHALLHLAGSVDLGDPRQLERLFNWCLQNGLVGRAADLLERARAQALDDGGLRRMQRRFEDQTRRPAASDAGATAKLAPSAIAAPLRASSKEIDAALDGLPDGVEAFFNQRLNVRLIAGCSAAKCHSRSSPTMPLWHDGQASSTPRGYAQRNLYEILQWVDRQQPKDSRLLEMARTAHGGQNEAAFADSGKAYSQLQYWTYAVSEHPEFYSTEVVGVVANSGSNTPLESPASHRDANSQIAQVGFTDDKVPAVPAQTDSKQAIGEPESAVDACDPRIFNRRYHPDRQD